MVGVRRISASTQKEESTSGSGQDRVVSKPCSCAALQPSLPRLIMKQAMIRQSPCWFAKISAFGSTEPHRIHSTLVGYRNAAFLASPGCLYLVAPRTCSVCDVSKMLHDRLAGHSSISDYLYNSMFHIRACIEQVRQAVKEVFSQAASFWQSSFFVLSLWSHTS
jgi:hypothetical protein